MKILLSFLLPTEFQYHCKSGDILVDDRPDNCAQWKEANGIAIRVDYQNYNKALQELEEILEKKLSLRSLKNLKSNVR